MIPWDDIGGPVAFSPSVDYNIELVSLTLRGAAVGALEGQSICDLVYTGAFPNEFRAGVAFFTILHTGTWGH